MNCTYESEGELAPIDVFVFLEQPVTIRMSNTHTTERLELSFVQYKVKCKCNGGFFVYGNTL
jgi:hypothetical protein